MGKRCVRRAGGGEGSSADPRELWLHTRWQALSAAGHAEQATPGPRRWPRALRSGCSSQRKSTRLHETASRLSVWGRARIPCPRAEAAERRCVQPSGWNRSDRLTSHQLPRPPRLLPRQLHPHPREAGTGCGRTCTPSVPCCARSPWRVAAVLGGGGCPSSLGLGLGVCRLAGRPGRGDLGLLTPDTHSARSAFSLLGYDTVRFGVFGNCQNVQRGCSKDLDRFAQRQR